MISQPYSLILKIGSIIEAEIALFSNGFTYFDYFSLLSFALPDHMTDLDQNFITTMWFGYIGGT